MTTRPPARRFDVAVRRSRSLTEADRQIWTAYVRLVAPLPGRALDPPDPAPEVPPSAPPAAPAALPPVARTAPVGARQVPSWLMIGVQPGGVDNSAWNRLRSGKLPPSRTLDLHGRTAQRAFHDLYNFLLSAQADGVRCVEVITGRGSGESGGVLRRELPLWLNLPALRPLVLAAAHPHAANVGAVRLLLRRVRV
jgi:DNA-nicking Smr family endonuclease